MKKAFLLLGFVFALVAFANAQRVYDLPDVTLTDAATVYSAAVESTSSSGTIALQATFTNVSGTTAGTATLEASIDGTTYVTLAAIAGKYEFYSSASVTVTDGVTMQVIITDSAFKYYRFKTVGSGTQSTTTSYSYLPKLK